MSHPVLFALKSLSLPEVSFVDIDAGGKKSYSLRLFDLTKQGSTSRLSSHRPRSSCDVKQNKQDLNPRRLLPNAA